MVLLHKKQHLFLRAQEDLNPEDIQERERIGARLPILEKAWQLKEALRTWYATATVADAAQTARCLDQTSAARRVNRSSKGSFPF